MVLNISVYIKKSKYGLGAGMITSIYPPVKKEAWASLVAQWLRICLPVQGIRDLALVREDPTCRGATKPVRHNY